MESFLAAYINNVENSTQKKLIDEMFCCQRFPLVSLDHLGFLPSWISEDMKEEFIVLQNENIEKKGIGNLFGLKFIYPSFSQADVSN